MYRIPFRRRRRSQREGRVRPALGGCLLWFLILIAILIVVALLFGGFRKGTRTGGLGPAPARVTGLLAVYPRPAGPGPGLAAVARIPFG